MKIAVQTYTKCGNKTKIHSGSPVRLAYMIVLLFIFGYGNNETQSLPQIIYSAKSCGYVP